MRCKDIPKTPLALDSKSAQPKLGEVRSTPQRGKGVFAIQDINAFQIVLQFGGRRTLLSDKLDCTYCLEIGNKLFLGPSGEADDFVNHSCDPNCRVCSRDGGFFLESIRSISVAEEILFDYSATMLDDPTSFRCSCGAANCRGSIQSFRVMAPEQRNKLIERGLVPDFILASMR